MEYGTIRIKLDELLKASGLSKNMLSHRAEMQRTQINNYCKNQITRLDIDVLARLCTVLNCGIGDLLRIYTTRKDRKMRLAGGISFPPCESHYVFIPSKEFCTLHFRKCQPAHAPQTDTQSREVVQRGGGGWRQDSGYAQSDQRTIEADDKTIIGVDARH